MTSLPRVLVLAVLALVTVVPSASALTQTATNGTDVSVDAGNTTRPVVISGMTGTITGVDVVFGLFSHTRPGEMDIALVSPAGVRTVLISDAGGSSAAAADDIANFNFGISESGVPNIPTPLNLGGNNFQPNDYEPSNGEFASVAGFSGALPANMSVFDGANPNGTWTVAFIDEAAGDIGSFDSVSVEVTTTDVIPPNPPTNGFGGDAVFDGFPVFEQPDVDQVDTLGSVGVRWLAGSDSDSGVWKYEWCLNATTGTCVGAIRSGVANRDNLSIGTAATPQLVTGTKYHACVRTVDYGGLLSAYRCSDGFTSTAVDVCSNIGGEQATVPDGFVATSGACALPGDVCANIFGLQSSLGNDLVLVGGACLPKLTFTKFVLAPGSIAHRQVKLPTVAVTTSRAGTMALSVRRSVLGYKSGTKCQVRKPAGVARPARCTLLVATTVKTTKAIPVGASSVMLPATFWRALGPGTYSITATIKLGAETATRSTNFVVRPAALR